MGNILILEDDKNTRDGIINIIKDIDNNAKIFATGSVSEGRKLLNENEMDIILIDIQLEDGNGFEFSKEIRTIDKYKLTHIVFITAVPTHAIMAFSETHCYSYIIKPFNTQSLKKELETLINYGYKSNENKKLELHLKNCIYLVNHDEIMFIEAKNKKIFVITREEEIEVHRTTLLKLSEELSVDFIRCHKAYIINKKMIETINKTERIIILKDFSQTIPIGRIYYQEIIDEIKRL